MGSVRPASTHYASFTQLRFPGAVFTQIDKDGRY